MPPINDQKSILKRRWNLPFFEKFSRAVSAFSLTEKIVFYALAAFLAVSGFLLLSRVSETITTAVPAYGGSFSEGVIGLPRFINPLLALSDTDRDLTALIYSGLLREDAEGKYVADLAKSYENSEDGLSYTVTLRDDAKFHDGVPVTADDIIFTVLQAQDINLKSPKRVNWEGVKTEKIDERTVRFILRQPYSPFIGNLTLGILPKHIWKDVETEQFPFSLANTEPVGSGPYKILKIKRDASGLPLFYQLGSFDEYALGEPYISEITMRFYANQDALATDYAEGIVESMSAVAPEEVASLLTDQTQVLKAPSSRIFGVFFNQNQSPVLARREIRQALEASADREEIIQKAIGGYASAINSPTPPKSLSTKSSLPTFTASTTAVAKAILTKKGWTENKDTGFLELITTDTKTKKKTTLPFAFTLSTSNAPELKNTANILKEQWKKIGADVTVKTYEPGDLTQQAIRPRAYDALLFGEIVGENLDLYAFWHSSQRLDPGLNIALYTNTTADKLLEKMRTDPDSEKRAKQYAEFAEEVRIDVPAVFLYSPDFLYVVPARIEGQNLGQIAAGAERFSGISSWYIETDRVWNFILTGLAKAKEFLLR